MTTHKAANKEAIRAHHERFNAKSSLLQLPTELRDAIYELVLPERLGKVVFIRSRDKIIRPPILRVCSQIRREAGEIWYTKVIFTARLTDMPLALTWVKTLPPDAMALLRHLHLISTVYCRCEDQSTNFGSIQVKSTRSVCIRLDDGPVCPTELIDEDDDDDDWKTFDAECPTINEVNKRIDLAREGLGDCAVKASMERQDLLALVKAFDVAQRGRLHTFVYFHKSDVAILSARLHSKMDDKMTALRRAIRAYQEQANSKPRLLRLPPELRNAIYQLVLPARVGDIVCIRSRDRIIRPPILGISRRIRKETASLWYTSVVFTARLADIPIALTWIKTLPEDAMSLVRNVHITASIMCHCEHKNANGMDGVENLLKLFIRRSNLVLPFNDLKLKEHPGEWNESSDEEDLKGCPTVNEVQRRGEAAMRRAVLNNETYQIQREDLLELLKILNDAQVKPLKLCMGRSAWLR